jgi:probable rRNA maturation factor
MVLVMLLTVAAPDVRAVVGVTLATVHPAVDHAGDICVSVDTALAYAEKHQLPFAEELLRYVIHGWLHLAGFDDLEPRKKRRHRAAEDRALKLLRAADLVPAFTIKSR